MKNTVYTILFVLLITGIGIKVAMELKGCFDPQITTTTHTSDTTITPTPTLPIPAKTDSAKAKPTTTTKPTAKEREYQEHIFSLLNRIASDSGAHQAEVDSVRQAFTRLLTRRTTTFRDTITVKDSTTGRIISQVEEAHYIGYSPVDTLFTKHTDYTILQANRVEVKETTTIHVEVSWLEKMQYRAEGFVAGAGVVIIIYETLKIAGAR